MGHRHSRHEVYNPPARVHVGPTAAQLQAKALEQQNENAKL